MKNVIVCKNCGTENPFYGLICTQCNSYLRERVVNIDLWSMMAKLIESPTSAFKKVIFAEHKNFISFICFLTAIKLFVNSMIVQPYVLPKYKSFDSLTSALILSLLVTVGFFAIYSFILKIVIKRLGIKTRFKDNATILIYSTIPMIFSLIFLFPVELVLYGVFLFSSNPSPFFIKPAPSYILSGLEVLVFFWSALLSFFAVKTITRSIVLSLIASIVFISAIFFIPVLIALL